MQRARPARARNDAAAQLVQICTPFFTSSRRIYWRVMGVHGLTTYLRDHKRTLSRSVQFAPGSGASTPLVVDGWSYATSFRSCITFTQTSLRLIYAVYDERRHPWIFGGEYALFYDDIQRLARAWISIGLKPYFVFDGMCGFVLAL